MTSAVINPTSTAAGSRAEGADRADAEVARRLEQPLVDPVQRREQRDDEERQVAVGEAITTVKGCRQPGDRRGQMPIALFT